GLSKLYITEQIAAEDDKENRDRYTTRRRWAATALQCSQELIDGATYRDHEAVFKIIEDYAAPEDVELQEFTSKYKEAAGCLDDELVSYLQQYARIISSGDLMWPTQGWSGAPEEEAVVNKLSVRRDEATRRLNELEKLINQKITV
ncbi:MAG: hypothetical protein WA843_04525, partial [Candidatus Saccharimonadales bacterium]